MTVEGFSAGTIEFTAGPWAAGRWAVGLLLAKPQIVGSKRSRVQSGGPCYAEPSNIVLTSL